MNYTVKVDTVIRGRPVNAGDSVTLTEEEAKPYIKAGLLIDGSIKDQREAPAEDRSAKSKK